MGHITGLFSRAGMPVYSPSLPPDAFDNDAHAFPGWIAGAVEKPAGSNDQAPGGRGLARSERNRHDRNQQPHVSFGRG